MKKNLKFITTGTLLVVAAVLASYKYWDYLMNPWTRNGQVMAKVIQIAPRVSGPIVDLPVLDNQLVKAGDLLFQIDPRTYEVALAQAMANLESTSNTVKSLEKQVESAQASVEVSEANIAQVKSTIQQLESQIYTNKREFDRQLTLLPKGSTSQKEVDKARTAYEVSEQQKTSAIASMAQAEAALRQSEAALAKARASLGKVGDENSQYKAAVAAVRQAELNLEFTSVRAPVDGYVTNLNLRFGSNTVANQPILALVDINSFWIDGFFKETNIGGIRSGDEAIVTLMSYNNQAIMGAVESIGWGISQQDGSTGYQMLPNVNPTFEWIRLAQRIPVRIHLTELPEGVELRVGATCSVLVKTGDSDKKTN